MRLTELQPVYCTTFPRPEAMEPGKLYISHEFKLANHLCPCGCGQQAVTPFDYETFPNLHWKLTENEGRVTLRASILNRACPNRSHYYITDNKIQWL